MKKIVYSLFALAIIISACTKTPEPIRFSILGDSFSAFKGYVQPDSNDVYHYEDIGVKGPEQMWWSLVADSTGWILERNNSFSGSLVCNYDYVGYYGQYSFINRMDDLGHPDVIFIFGATNDAYAHSDGNPFDPVVSLGEYIYDDWTSENLCDFRPGLSFLFHHLKKRYPKARLYFLLDMNLGSGGVTEQRRTEFIESIHQIAFDYRVDLIDLWDIRKSQWHPNAKGQADIAKQVLEYINFEPN